MAATFIEFERACTKGDEKAVKKMLEKGGVDFTDFNQGIWKLEEYRPYKVATPMVRAVQFKKAGILKILMDDGRSDPSASQSLVLMVACEMGEKTMVDMLLNDKRKEKQGYTHADPTIRDNTAIIKACKNGHFEIVNMLLEDARVNSVSNLKALKTRLETIPEVTLPLTARDKLLKQVEQKLFAADKTSSKRKPN